MTREFLYLSRRDGDQVNLPIFLGMGIEDVVAAMCTSDRAESLEVGVRLPL